jgi:E3 ubiquitin-protein ligase BRE1
LQDRESALRDTITTYEERINRLTEEVNQAQLSKKAIEDSCTVWMTRVLALFLLTLAKASTTQSVQELKAMMVKREVENARLRDQREQLNAELVERKQKDSVKMASLQEYKTLAESRSASRPQYQHTYQY